MFVTAAEVPKVTDWLQAWGSIGSAVLTGLAVVIAALALRKELRARREERADAEAGDARLVWAEVLPGHNDESDRTILVLQWVVHNKSGGIVRDVVVQLIDEPRSDRRKRKEAGNVAGPDWHVPHVLVIPPGESVRGGMRVKSDRYTRASIGWLLAEITFTDRRGNRWSRLGHDQPTRSVSKVMPRFPFATASDLQETPRSNRIGLLLWEYCWIDSGIDWCRWKGAVAHLWVVRLLQKRLQKRDFKALVKVEELEQRITEAESRQYKARSGSNDGGRVSQIGG